MSTFDLLIIWFNVALAAASTVTCGWAATRDDPRHRVLWGAMAAMALFYTIGYIWLAVLQDVVPWSRFFRGVSLMTWPLVWTVPPIVLTRRHRSDLRYIRKIDQ